jgi:GNAT superfamily N-acetyltransferase
MMPSIGALPRPLRYARGGADDCDAMAALLRQVWEDFLVADFTEEATRNFFAGNDAAHMRDLIDEGAFFFVARDGDAMGGMIGVVPGPRIKYLFVGGPWHRRGVARRLLTLALAELRHRGIGETVTLNASDYGLKAYERLGFVATDARQQRNGIWFTPMRWAG